MIKIRVVHNDMRCDTAILIINEDGEGNRTALYHPDGVPTWTEFAPYTEAPVAYRFDDTYAEEIMKGLIDIFAPELAKAAVIRSDYDHEQARVDKLLDVVANSLTSLIEQ